MQLANIEASSSEGQYAQTEPSSDEKLAELQYAIARQPLLREILYKILQFCRVEANLETLEKEVASFPEYAMPLQHRCLGEYPCEALWSKNL